MAASNAGQVNPYPRSPDFKVAAVAQANKTARIIWALLNQSGTYRRAAPLVTTVVSVV